MKKPTLAHLIAIPLLGLSSMAFAAQETLPTEVMQLSENQMDEVTAGRRGGSDDMRAGRHHGSDDVREGNRGFSRRDLAKIFKFAQVSQVNMSPVIIVQIGNNNSAIVFSGNFSSIFQ